MRPSVFSVAPPRSSSAAASTSPGPEPALAQGQESDDSSNGHTSSRERQAPTATGQPATAIFRRLAGEQGEEFADLSGATIRSVVQGVLGIAIIQSVLAGIGLIAVEVPAAGLWALIVLFLAVIQLPPLLVLGPIIFYVFSVTETTPAVLFMIWSILVSVSDTFLKPLLLGRGVEVPMLVILLGAIGGMMLSGLIGLFVGSVVLSLGYKVFQAWLNNDPLLEQEST